MEFKCLPFHEIGHVIAANINKHYEEIQQKDAYGIVNADWRSYLELSGRGACVVFCVFDDNELVAYSVFIISANMNHKTLIDAMNVALYVYPKYRAKITTKFLKWSHKLLLEKKVNEIAYALNDERLGKILKRVGMKPTHTVWTLRNE